MGVGIRAKFSGSGDQSLVQWEWGIRAKVSRSGESELRSVGVGNPS